MYDPNENKFVPVEDEGYAILSPEQRGWTKFQEGEVVQFRGIYFRIHEIGESRIVLKPIKQ